MLWCGCRLCCCACWLQRDAACEAGLVVECVVKSVWVCVLCVHALGWFMVRVCAAAGAWQSVLVLVWSCVRGCLDCRWC